MRVTARNALTFAGMSMLAALAACMPVSKAFHGPGEEGKRLVANLPPPRLAVPPMDGLFHDHEAAITFARAMTRALVAQSLPAVTKMQGKGDWWLDVAPAPASIGLVPRFTIMAPDGKAKGHVDGAGHVNAKWTGLTQQDRDLIALDGAPRIAALLTGIQAEAMMADPQSLKRRAARIQFLGVKGAPGDGDIALARAFAATLPDRFDELTTVPGKADFTVTGLVHLFDGKKGTTGRVTQAVEIIWRVRDHDGKEAGAATQLHDIPAGTLDHAWGDVAVAAAQEAAGAVRQIITTYSGRNHKPLPRDAH